MSMYRNYLERLEGVETFEMPGRGFIQYRINDDKSCYISAIHVEESLRDMGHSYDLEKKVYEIAKEKGCDYIYCQSDANNKDLDSAVVTIIKNGYSIQGWEGPLIQFYKEIK